MSQPIDTARACLPSLLIDLLNEGTPHAFAACRFEGEKILQIAGWRNRDGAAVEDEVHQSEELTGLLGDQRVHRLVLIEEARPGHVCDGIGECSRVFAAIEGVIA